MAQNKEEVNFKNALKTNEEASDVSKIITFSEALSETNNSATNELIDSWIDKDIFLKTLVVDRRIAHDDGFLHFYHQGGDFTNLITTIGMKIPQTTKYN